MNSKIKFERVLLPENFNVQSHIEKNPPELWGFENRTFKPDKMRYVLGLLNKIPAGNKDLISETGYVPIHSKTIRNHVRDYKLYIDYLINTDIVESKKHYRPGVESMGYRFTEQYFGARKVIHVQKLPYKDKVKEDWNNQCRDAYPYLFYWYDQLKLKINGDAAKDFAYWRTDYKMRDQSRWDVNHQTGMLKHPVLQYGAIMHNIAAFEAFDYGVHIDGNVRRLYSVLTNMQSDFRNFVTYDGNSLVNIDIKNSQPYLACILFDQGFWNGDSYLSINQLPENIWQRVIQTGVQANVMDYLAKFSGQEFDEYSAMVSKGIIYDVVADVRNKVGKDIERDEAKIAMFCMLFSSNRGGSSSPYYWFRKYFAEIFPSVSEIFKIIKHDFKIFEGIDGKQHGRLACLLQSIESEIVLHRICKRIWEDGKQQVPVFTIHDSLVTTVEHEYFVTNIMIDELTKSIGVRPKLKPEPWNPISFDDFS